MGSGPDREPESSVAAAQYGVGASRGSATAEVTTRPEGKALDVTGSTNGAARVVAECLFCGRPAGSVGYAWPEWLCRYLADQLGSWKTERKGVVFDLVTLEGMRAEVDKTLSSVCATCSQGWMQRLEEGVGPFLQSMIVGNVTALSPVRRRLLARWAAKTAIIMEYVSDTPARTPPFVCDHLRRIGVHAGTQVLVGNYTGDRQVLSYEHDVFSRIVDGKKRYLSQSTFVIGKLFIEVFADPWRDRPPELTERATRPFIPLITDHERTLTWPPDVAIDDARLDLVQPDVDEDTRTPQHAVEDRRETIMAIDQITAAQHDADRSPAIAGPARTVSFRRLGALVAAVVVLLGVAAGSVGYGLHERSNARQWHTNFAASQSQLRTVDGQLGDTNEQLSASHTQLEQLESTTTTPPPASGSGPSTPDQIDQLVSTVPSVTKGLRQCANAALATAADALSFAAAYPKSTTQGVTDASNAVLSACGTAATVADTLDRLATNAKP